MTHTAPVTRRDHRWWHRPLRHLRLWRRFVAQSLVRDTQYRMHFFAIVSVGMVQLALALVPVLLLFGYTDSVRGWSRGEVVALVGLHQIINGLTSAFLAPNLARMTTYITQGELDTVLVRPVSAQFLLTFRWVRLAELGNVVTGAAVLVVGLSRASVAPGPGDVLRAVLLLGCGLVLLACAWSAMAFLAFWLHAVEPVTLLFIAIVEAGRYPLAFFPAGVRAFLTFAVPVAFATTMPIDAVRGGLGWDTVLGGVAFCAVAIALVRAMWRLGLRSYASASS